MNKRTLNVVTAATFALLSIFELVRALLGHAWPGYSALGNLVDVVHIPCWTAAAVGLFLRRSWGYAFAALSTILVFTHGVGINAGGSKQGVPFMLIGVATFVLIQRGQPWTESQRRRRSEADDAELSNQLKPPRAA